VRIIPVPAELPDRMATTPGSTLLSTAWMLEPPVMGGAVVPLWAGAVVGGAVCGLTTFSLPLVATAMPPPVRPPRMAASRAMTRIRPAGDEWAGASGGGGGAVGAPIGGNCSVRSPAGSHWGPPSKGGGGVVGGRVGAAGGGSQAGPGGAGDGGV